MALHSSRIDIVNEKTPLNSSMNISNDQSYNQEDLIQEIMVLRTGKQSVTQPSHDPSPQRIAYLWRRAKCKGKTVARLIKVWRDIQIYGGSRNHYASTIAWKESFEEDEEEIVHKWILLPNSSFKKYWSLVIAFLLIWTATVVPYEVCYLDDNYMWLSIDLTIDGLFIIDIIINFNTAYVDDEGKIITNRKSIAKRYLTTWFLIDLIACIPFPNLMNNFNADGNKNYGFQRLARVLRLLRMYRLVRVSRLFKVFKWAKNSEFITTLINTLRVTTGLLRMIKFIFIMLIVIHIVSCLWYYIARVDDFSYNTWVYRYGFLDDSKGELYLTSIYYVAQTIATVGFGDIVPLTSGERIFALVLMGIGVGFYSYTVSNLSTIMATLDIRSTNLKNRLSALAEFAKFTKLPEELRVKIRKHIIHNHQENVYTWFDKDALLKELPASLRREISIHMHKRIVEKIAFFQDKDPQFISLIVPKLKNVHMQSGEILFKDDDYAEEIYFLVKGRVNFKKNGIVFKTYSQGSYFGEVDVLNNKLRSYTAQVASQTGNFLVLSKRDLMNFMKEFTNIAKEVKATADVRETKYKDAIDSVLNSESDDSFIVKKKKKTKPHSDSEDKLILSKIGETQASDGPFHDKDHLGKIASKRLELDSTPRSKPPSLDTILQHNASSPFTFSTSSTPIVSSIVFSPTNFKVKSLNERLKIGQDSKNFEIHDDSAHFSRDNSRIESETGDLRSILHGLNESEEIAERNLEGASNMLLEMERTQESMLKKLKDLISELESQ
ncbi:unnamed protein product [Blepharisma stoltei]|uniref:Cyclic nucleotide-binding domain-containing protein n=1 Tax=Blepharisma stoltei TaxID=1481888 RepID=A0AAU9IHB4_9CILI|nr:unnamed protein product [Blepharisma stoltei]